MERKTNFNVVIIMTAMTVVVTIIISLISYGIIEKYTGDFKPVTLKGFIGSSIPLVEYTYDSGKTEYSFFSNIKGGVYNFTGIDTSDPIKMLQGSSLHNYYIENHWQSRLNSADIDSNDDNQDHDSDPIVTPKTEGPTSTPGKTPPPAATDGAKYAKGNIVTVRNGTKKDIDISEIVKTPFYSKFQDASDGPQILIYHTHTTECYIKDLSELDNNNYDSWSTDNSKTVVRAGHELDSELTKYGFYVMHNSTVHNSSYNESYNKSSVTVRSVIKGNPTIKLSIDTHRDGLALGTGKLRVVQNVNGVDCAKVMFVVGADENGANPNWEDNLRLAILLAEKLEELAPGITRYISLRSSRYNEHIAQNGMLIEFGGDGNTIDEVIASAGYVAKAINEIMK